MERLQKLIEKFPQIPRSIIIKTDVCREGIRRTEDLSRIGRWAQPEGGYGFDWDHGESPHTSDEAGEGWLYTPANLRLRDGTYIFIELAPSSPYEVRYEAMGSYCLYRDGQPVEEVMFCPRPDWYDKRCSDGTMMSTVAMQCGDSAFMFYPMAYCQYCETDDHCVFCGLTAFTQTIQELGLEKQTVQTAQRATETFTVALAEARDRQGKYLKGKIPCGKDGCRCLRVELLAGSFWDLKKEEAFYLRIIEALKKADPEDELLIHLVPQAMPKETSRRFHEAGVHSVCYDLEVWQERLFPIICPGKAKNIGRERWIQGLLEATEFFERGHVQTNFVAGVEMAGPDGIKDVNEALESTLSGFEWLLQHDINPVWTMWANSPGSKYEQESLPPTEYFLRLGWEYHQLMLRYDMYQPTWIGSCYHTGCNTGDYARMRWPDSALLKSRTESADVL